jgi:hypothetical protein
MGKLKFKQCRGKVDKEQADHDLVESPAEYVSHHALSFDALYS